MLNNKDGNYLVGDMADRVDWHHKTEIRDLLKRLNLQLIYKQDGYLFSHAGVLPRWIEDNFETDDSKTALDVVKTLNRVEFSDASLLCVSPYRGGYSSAGSCVWGDVREYNDAYQFKEWYQIFGHTQLEKEVITDTYACLDCRKAFVLDTETRELKEFKI